MPVRLRTPIDGVPNLLHSLLGLTRHQVLVGVPSDDEQPHFGVGKKGPNKRADAHPAAGQPMTNAILAYIHTHGSPAAHIPPRPFMEPAIEAASSKLEESLRAAGEAALDGQWDSVERYLHRTGIIAQTAIRLKMRSGLQPPLKPATVARRRQRTKGSKYRRTATSPGDVKPLIDTGQLLNSITYVIRKLGARSR